MSLLEHKSTYISRTTKNVISSKNEVLFVYILPHNFLLNCKYYFRNELLRFTRCIEQTVNPLKHTFKAKKVKNMEAEINRT